MPSIPWRPRVILPGRSFRLPVQATDDNIALEADHFETIATRWCERDTARYYYLRSPQKQGDYTLIATHNGNTEETTIQVRTLDDLRQPHTYNGAQWPRRWPLGQNYHPTKTRQTLQNDPKSEHLNEKTLAYWSSQPDHVLWSQLPPAELPKAHFANCHQGCPNCGTAIFKYSGFYPWLRNHMPCDFKSKCPHCAFVYPSNDLTKEDYISGEHADDGYGYFDAEGHIYLFAATYHRDQCRAYHAGINALTDSLRAGDRDEERTRKLGLMLLRYATEEVYLASVPQFRYGPSKSVEEPWEWGQPDWAEETDPVAALSRKGSIRYSIDTPYLIESLALAYDTVWPFLKEDTQLVERAQAFGLSLQSPEDTCLFIEEMLAALLQVTLDRGAGSNLPRESQGALILLRCLDRADAQDVMDWVYDEGPDTLRVFTTNDILPDGTPQESTGGYNAIHSDGLFDLEYDLRNLRTQHPEAYPESLYPSLFNDPRGARVPRALCEITMIGKSYFQFGDGSAPGSAGIQTEAEGSIRLENDLYHAPMNPSVLERAIAFTSDPHLAEIQSAVQNKQHRALGPTILDSVGIAILRTPEAPERAAVGIAYGDTMHHRHRDLLDVQLFAFDRPFLTDLGYPQSWASTSLWEAHWATHNTIWADLPPGEPTSAGRGRLVRALFTDGIQILDIEAYRWALDPSGGWRKLDITFRRLIALIETDGEGIALLDLSRIAGGAEHWRTCRGLEGIFQTDNVDLKPQPGTVAGPDIQRTQTDNLPHPDHTALAYMDSVTTAQAPPTFRGTWQSQIEPAVHLDLHQLNTSPNTQIINARAAQAMGKPEESNYLYHPLLWRRTPDNDTTCIDLVFEPHIGNPTLAKTIAIPSDNPTAAGIHLTTAKGKQIALYWAPNANPDDKTQFENGVALTGALAVVADSQISTMGATAFQNAGTYPPNPPSYKEGGNQVSPPRLGEGSESVLRQLLTNPHARQTGRIIALNRDTCTIDIEGLQDIAAGDRITINSDGRAHSYRIKAAKQLDTHIHRLTLDITSILGRAKIIAIQDNKIDLGFHIMAKSGNLHGTRLQTETSDDWAVIENAQNASTWPPGKIRTTIYLDPNNKLQNLSPGTWVQAVDYVIGDPVLFEPLCRG